MAVQKAHALKDLTGKTAVVTGATSGIGREVAEALAVRGARVLAVARDPARAGALVESLAPAGQGRHGAVIGDLSRLSEMKRLAGEIAAAEPSIDLLINNAGGMFATRQETADGLERTFALNHMAYFVMTLGLLHRLKAAPAARIINTSSRMHGAYQLDFDDLQMTHGYDGYRAYGRSKLANILFTRSLARRLEGSGVTANAAHPGFVRTALGDEDTSLMGRLFVWMKVFALSPEAGAQTTMHVATSEEGGRLSGAYFAKSRPVQPSPAARNDADAERLWAATEAIAEREA